MPTTPTLPQGQSFSVLAKLGPNVITDLQNWTPACQIRKVNNSQPSGFVANLSVDLHDPEEMIFRLYMDKTDHWPLGLVELDLRFTSPDGLQTLITNRREFEITRSVTKTISVNP